MLLNKSDLPFHYDQLIEEARKLFVAKNEDYSSSANPLNNIMACEGIGLCGGDVGVLVRLLDKMARLSSHASKKRLVNETVKDSILDAINYLVLLHLYYLETNGYRREGTGA